MLLLIVVEVGLLGFAAAAARRPENGVASVHWSSWQPWVCMCDLRRQARIRHFVVRGRSSASRLEASEFWQEKACSSDECPTCAPGECPAAGAGGSSSPPSSSRLGGLLPAKPHDVVIPLPPQPDFPSYDSLPVVDDTGDT